MRNEQTEARAEPAPEQENWEEFGFEPAEVPGWIALGFGPFEAAMAHADGYTPMFAAHYTGPLQKMAAFWTRVGLGTPETALAPRRLCPQGGDPVADTRY